jgi:hypothetical protein
VLRPSSWKCCLGVVLALEVIFTYFFLVLFGFIVELMACL